jgi:tRNA dimethylallyltransferase
MSELLRRRCAPPSYRMLRIVLEPGDRAILHRRIAQRLHTMLENGLIDEVIALRDRYPLDPSLPSMRAVGYRQVWQFLAGEVERGELASSAAAATRQLAKRQLTWLRAMRDVSRFDCLAPDLFAQVSVQVERML